jgi:signal transduction histidine kinase
MSSKELRIPSGVWGWAGTALVVLVVVLPPLVTLGLDPDARNLTEAAAVVGLVVHVVSLAAALLLYFHWRLTLVHATAWLAAALTAGSIKGLALAGMRVAYPEAVQAHAAVIMVLDLLFAVAILLMVTLAQRRVPPMDPAALGIVVGLAIAGVRFGLVSQDPLLAVAPNLLAAGNLLLLTLHLGFAWAVLNLYRTPIWAGVRLSLAVGLLSANRAISYPSLDGTFATVAALVTDAAGAVLLCGTSLAMLRMSIRDNASTVDALHDRVAEVEQAVREDRERLHEINATIAGIATATRLIHDGPQLTTDRRGMLQDMLDSEIARLERLVDHRTAHLHDVDLDKTIQPLVVAQQAMGRHVQWTPSGHVASGRADDIAEVLTTLLNNAAQHAPGAAVSVSVRCDGGMVEIKVADCGPGISREMAARIFEWGERGPQSEGQGIGLNVAKRLASELGGSLRALPSQSHAGFGAVFVLTLHPSRNSHGAARARAK